MPRVLGEKKTKEINTAKNDNDEELILKTGSYVRIINGRRKGEYGTVSDTLFIFTDTIKFLKIYFKFYY